MEEIKPRLRTRDEISELAPELCVDCKGSVKQWDETDDEISQDLQLSTND